jgi:hypothetical protein
VLQKTNQKTKAWKNKLIATNQLLLKGNCVPNVIKQRVLCKYIFWKFVHFRLGEFIYRNFGWYGYKLCKVEYIYVFYGTIQNKNLTPCQLLRKCCLFIFRIKRNHKVPGQGCKVNVPIILLSRPRKRRLETSSYKTDTLLGRRKL